MGSEGGAPGARRTHRARRARRRHDGSAPRRASRSGNSGAAAIALHGSTITQRNDLPNDLVVRRALGVRGSDMVAMGWRARSAAEPMRSAVRRERSTPPGSGGPCEPKPGDHQSRAGLARRLGQLICFLGRLDCRAGSCSTMAASQSSGIAIFSPRAPRFSRAGMTQVQTPARLLDGSIALPLSGMEETRRSSSSAVLCRP